ncbi:cytochrome c oxidase assembly protein [Pseudonocardia spinosispora]|uniref:cytochrome c oxidase assembly protein n=1 Tax=Pseudonocardia spinosispora TaxID=103441 RepID=UPI000686EFD3|nr:cytochrome c oxidase assembly protein [Pseudonocardia spinosispora]
MVTALVTAGYSGPPPLTVWRGVSTWTVDPAAIIGLVAAAGYLLGARALRGRGVDWPSSRSWSFVAGGIGTLLVVTAGPIGSYAGVLFWVRAVQNVTLLMIVPMFLAMGAPLTMLRDLAPAGRRAALSRVLHSAAARRLTFPLVITPIFVAPLPLIYLTPIYEAGLDHTWAGALVGLWLLGSGWMYFWTRFRIDPTPRTDTYLVSLGISAAEVVLDGALGLAVWLGPLIAARYYQGLARPWGPDIRTDQIIGAGILWIGGDLAGLPFLGIVLRRMTSEDAEQAAEIDAELDRQEVELAAEPDDGRPKLWWEDHPELAERFRRR